jgi:hypothetical protein
LLSTSAYGQVNTRGQHHGPRAGDVYTCNDGPGRSVHTRGRGRAASERVWVPGHYRTTPTGRRVWVQGRYEVRVVSRPAPRPVCMRANAFDAALRRMRRASFESTRMSIGEHILRNNPVSSAQVARMLFTFNFDSRRLDFAIFAYDYVIDPHNYHRTYDAFTFERNIRRLNRYMDGY